MRKLLISLVGLLFALHADAQTPTPFGYYQDALRFSQSGITGSTRIQSLAGTQISLGGDLSSALSNPAGLGFFNQSSFTFTPAIDINNSEGIYLGVTSNDTRTRFNFSQLGVVLALEPEEGATRKGSAFSVSFSRLNDFNRNYGFTGFNENTTIVDSFLEQAAGETTAQFSGNDLVSLGYFNYLIGPFSILNPPGPADLYFTDVPPGMDFQTESFRTTGAQNQWSFAYGSNLGDVFFFGAGFGIQTINYESERIYQEEFPSGPLIDLIIAEQLEISGSGINGTVGIIVKPVPILNLGVSFISPTLFGLEDVYTADMSARWDNFLYEDNIDGDTLLNDVFAQTDILTSEYDLTTPWRLNGGATVFVGKNGFISADVEYYNLTNAHLRSDLFSMRDDNQIIDDLGSSILNFRVGAEYRLQPLRLRAGFANYAGNRNSIDSFANNSESYSGGIGYKSGKLQADLGFVYSRTLQSYSPYILEEGDFSPTGELHEDNVRVLLTVGLGF